jgi:hypothetical protein
MTNITTGLYQNTKTGKFSEVHTGGSTGAYTFSYKETGRFGPSRVVNPEALTKRIESGELVLVTKIEY